MPSCLPPRYRLLDLVFALWGTVAFLGDLGIDVWSAVKYYKSGDTVFAVLHFGLYVLSSCVLQLLSWGWFWVDGRDSATETSKTVNGHTEQNGINADQYDNGAAGCDRRCSVDAAVFVDEKVLPEDNIACHRGADSPLRTNGHTEVLGTLIAANQDDSSVHKEQGSDICCKQTTAQAAEDVEYTTLSTHFYTSRICLWPSCLSILHLLQLGYPLRCLHSLEVGIAAYRSSESSPKFSYYQTYAYFLTHDISMMRLVETFLENTPQLILVLYIIIQRETIQLFQYFGIAISFICISWAILDYHQSLRLFLKDKKKLGFLSSMIYFLWNFCLISARIMCITLFAVTFHWMIALHFLAVWLAFFLWACLQKTEFMKCRWLEPFYRATVSVILYFSWFNIADGRTIYRCIVYHMFITIDSSLLLLSWKYVKFPSILDKYENGIIWTAVLLTGVGLLTRLFYYKCVHPNVTRETKEYYDEPDGITGEYRMFTPTVTNKYWKQNHRMAHLAQQVY